LYFVFLLCFFFFSNQDVCFYSHLFICFLACSCVLLEPFRSCFVFLLYLLSTLFIPPFISWGSTLFLYNFTCCVRYCFFHFFPSFVNVVRIWYVFQLWNVNAQHIFFLPVLPLQVFYVFLALFLVYTDSFGIFNFNFSCPWMFAVTFYMFLKCSEYLTAYVVSHNRRNIISGCYMSVNTRWNSRGAHCPSHLYLFPCIYRAKYF